MTMQTQYLKPGSIFLFRKQSIKNMLGSRIVSYSFNGLQQRKSERNNWIRSLFFQRQGSFHIKTWNPCDNIYAICA